MASLKEIGEKAGVSVSTVSHILSGRKSRYSAETKANVIDVARNLGYRPNLLAQSLRCGQTKTLGLIVPRFFMEMDPIEKIGVEMGYRVQMAAHHANEGGMREVVSDFLSRQVDGILIYYPQFEADDLLKDMLKEKPTVIVDFNKHPFCDCFVEDIQSAMWMAVSYLMKLGHKKIGLLGTIRRKVPYGNREHAYICAMQKAGLSIKQEWLVDLPISGGHPCQIGEDAINMALPLWESDEHRPTAIIASNSEVAVGALVSLQAAGISVPGDMSIIGLMDQDIARYVGVPITGVDTMYRQSSIDAMRHLLKVINTEEETDMICKEYSPRLMKRASCAVPKV